MPGETGESPLSNAGDWLIVTDKNGRKGRRETNTMPQWAGSCWYYLRFTDPTNNEEPFSKIAENYWMPVDLYVGGAEHAVLHLLYSRFWHKVLFDLGIVSTNEPFQKLFNQGMILAFAYETASGSKVPSDQVEEREGKYFSTVTGEELHQIVAKMSKSLKNVVNPDDVVTNYGADSLRLFEMFIGPLDATKPWTENGVKGVYNFLRRVVAFFGEKGNIAEGEESKETLKILHQTIRKVSDDVRDMKFNTAVSQMMVFTNHCYKAGKVNHQTAVTFFQVLAPFAPHVAEELWELYGNTSVLSFHPWPVFNEAYLTENTFEYPVSFNGKVRFKIELPVDMPTTEIEKAVLTHDHTDKWIEGKSIAKIIIVTNKIVNVVVK